MGACAAAVVAAHSRARSVLCMQEGVIWEIGRREPDDLWRMKR